MIADLGIEGVWVHPLARAEWNRLALVDANGDPLLS